MEHPEESKRTCLHPKHAQESGSSFRSHREADVSLRLGKAIRSPRVCRKQVRERLGERATLAPFIQAAEPAQTQVESNQLVADWEIGRGP